jgi:hypothetical protein
MLFKNHTLPVVLYGFETYVLGLVLREEHEEEDDEENYIRHNAATYIVLFTKCDYSNRIKENEIEGGCTTHG